jgi:hypothetical protein
VKEGDEIISERVADGVRDAALIAAAQRVEHYEVAAYGTLRSYAELLGEQEHASLLAETLQEEKEAEHMLTDVAQNISFQAPGTSKEKSEEIMEHTGPGVKQTPNQELKLASGEGEQMLPQVRCYQQNLCFCRLFLR